MLTLYEAERLPQLKQKELLAESEYCRRYKRAMKQKCAHKNLCRAIRQALKAGMDTKLLTTQFNLILSKGQEY